MSLPQTGFRRAAAVVAAVVACGTPGVAAEPAVEDAIRTIRAVGREGAGNDKAAAAWKKLVAGGPDALVPTLTAFDSASPTATNWLRAAIDGIVEAERAAKKPLPAAALEAFVRDAKRNPAARRVAFELYAAEAKDAAAKLLPTLIDDPSADIRRDAIAARLKASGDAKPELLTLFAAARDKDQVEDLAKRLEKLGEKPDVVRHFGYVTEWHVVGPFDGTGGTGFAKAFDPEAKTDPSAKYEGKKEVVAWKYAGTGEDDAGIDLNAALGKNMDAVAYAVAVIEVEKETPAEVRVNTPNAVQIFLNGQKVFAHEEYHHGANHDQYAGKGVLKAGRNVVLLKLCQNNQTEPWAQDWTFAARVCDATGGKLPVKQVITKDGKETTVLPGALDPALKKKKDPKEGK